MDDLRRPTGYLFTLLGAILLVYGLLHPEGAKLDLETNVNLWCGAMLFIFGGSLLWLSFRTRS